MLICVICGLIFIAEFIICKKKPGRLSPSGPFVDTLSIVIIDFTLYTHYLTIVKFASLLSAIVPSKEVILTLHLLWVLLTVGTTQA